MITDLRKIEASVIRRDLTDPARSRSTSDATPAGLINLSSISNMPLMKAYLKPKCSKILTGAPVSPQDCYSALSKFPFNRSSALTLSEPVTRSFNTCSITLTKVSKRNSNVQTPKSSNVEICASAIFGPIGQLLTTCPNQGGILYFWAGDGTNVQIKIDSPQYSG